MLIVLFTIFYTRRIGRYVDWTQVFEHLLSLFCDIAKTGAAVLGMSIRTAFSHLL